MRPARKPSRKLKFLVVDDMSNMRKTIRNMLRKLGYDDVTEAEDGDTALSRLKASRYDFVIADWNMPRMSGFELLMAVREDEALRNIPFLIVTAEINEATVAQAAEGEVDGYIIKPFFAMTLEEKINGILERRANPSQLEQHLRKARACLADGQLNQALAACEEALGLQPTSARAMTLMAEIFEKKGQPEQAEQSYKAALHHNPMFIKAHDQLGRLCERQGKRKEALEAFQAAVRISPSNSDRQMELGKALLEEGRVEEASWAFEEAVRVDRDKEKRTTEVGEAFLSKGQAERAITSFQQVLAQNPENLHVYNRLGIAFRQKGLYKEAIKEYLKALAIDPNDEVLHYNMGRAYLEGKDEGNAIKCFRKALELNPDFKDAADILKETIGS